MRIVPPLWEMSLHGVETLRAKEHSLSPALMQTLRELDQPSPLTWSLTLLLRFTPVLKEHVDVQIWLFFLRMASFLWNDYSYL